MCTSTVELDLALPGQPEMVIGLLTVDRSGIGTGVELVPVQLPPVLLTVNEYEVLCVADAAVPVMVTVDVPAGVDVVVLMVIVELPPAVIGLGLKEAVAPLGKPEADRVIDSA